MKLLLENNTPRWIVLLFDLCICTLSFFLAVFLRYNFQFPAEVVAKIWTILVFFLLIQGTTLMIFRINAGIVRYATFDDAGRILRALGIATLLLLVCNYASQYYYHGVYLMSTAIILIDFGFTCFLMVSSRVLVKILFWKFLMRSGDRNNAIVLGSGQLALTVKETLQRDPSSKLNIVAFIDEDSKDIGNKIDGVKVFSTKHLDDLLEKKGIDTIIIAKTRTNKALTKNVIEKCIAKGVRVLDIPDSAKWVQGELSTKQIRQVSIEMLLEREPIVLDRKNIVQQIEGQSILVTGAAGSIGSEIVRQLTQFSPKMIILLDQAETPMYDIELELRETHKFTRIEVIMCDVLNTTRLESIFNRLKPDIVYHAAAYKHVPLMEENPSEAVNNNVKGTYNVANLSKKYRVKKFVMVSTDKAVNPTNVMGASKRIAEIYCQSLSTTCDTAFITTRFGNVLGSNGSVIPRFKEQILKGGPVTVTHPEITRYFMTIPEACQLVLEAGAMGKGSEIFVFDMGESVKIVELARKMIKLHGLTLGKDIELKFVGLRPGEKLYEELLNDKENTAPTHHERIMVAKVREYDPEKVRVEIEQLFLQSGTEMSNMELVSKMKQIVPEFISENSVYSALD